jgi:hypothetical protein
MAAHRMADAGAADCRLGQPTSQGGADSVIRRARCLPRLTGSGGFRMLWNVFGQNVTAALCSVTPAIVAATAPVWGASTGRDGLPAWALAIIAVGYAPGLMVPALNG